MRQAALAQVDTEAEDDQSAPAPALTLRVLAGKIRGASAALELGRPMEIGHAFENDIVLRDPAAKGVRLRIRPRTDAVALEMVEGEVELLGHPLAAPATAVLPRYVPLVVGESAIAIGEEDNPRWAEAERLVTAAMRTDEDEEDASAEPAGAQVPRTAALLTRWHGLAARTTWALPAVAVGAIGGAILLTAAAAPELMRPTAKPEQVQALLAASGYPNVQVAKAGDGQLVVRGLVATEKDRARIQSLVKAREYPVSVQVQTGERLALTVEDVFRANGLEAKARSAQPGFVRVDVRGAGEGEVASVEKLALREVPGLKRLAVNRIGGPPAPTEAAAPAAPMIASGPGKRVVSVVDGPMDYVATEDGSRYFSGAILPTGHRIVQVEGQTVSVEKDGTVSQLVF